jgi:hypothetical protein
MHTNIGSQPISPLRAAFAENKAGRAYRCADEDTRRYWRPVHKRNRGHKKAALSGYRATALVWARKGR